ncbi:MAG TPA: RDD family protein [Halomicronema sp.]
MRFFNRITLQTPESVELEFTLAGIGSRLLALLIDYFLWSITLLILLFIWIIFSYQFIDILSQNLTSNQIQQWLTALYILINFGVYVGYFVFFETLWQGQTPGKRIANIRVIRDDGRSVRLPQATLRALLRPVDDILFLGMLLIILTPREKRLGDFLAGTVVVCEETTTKSPDFTLSEPAQKLSPKLIEVANISALLPDDFAIIREYLQRRKKMKPQAKDELSRQLAAQVKTIISLDKIPDKVSAEQFLEAVYLAYQQQFK